MREKLPLHEESKLNKHILMKDQSSLVMTHGAALAVPHPSECTEQLRGEGMA